MRSRENLLPRDGHDIGGSIGAALGRYAARRWPHHTAKHVVKNWGVADATGQNITKGHASPQSLAQAIRSEGYALLDAIGEALTGETRIEWEQAQINKIRRELIHASEQYDDLVSRAAQMQNLVAIRAGGGRSHEDE